jgi:RNA polymerase sigma-70 factor (ECF subfamily)
MAALQHLPPRQRAVLILREVLQWRAAEVAQLLDTSVASVNSALQRARATLAEVRPPAGGPGLDPAEAVLLGRYLDAFERYDMDALVTVLAEDATLSMPPYDMWLTGHHHIRAWMTGPGHGCAGSRLVPVAANGGAGFAQYRPHGGSDGGHGAWALQVIETSGGRITGITSFLDVEHLFPLFGLPLRLDSRG